jgi:sodium-coupled monocarboxylate transporter 8/12
VFRSIIYNAPAVPAVVWLSGLTGLSIFANYAYCDPLKAGIISRPDEIVPYYVLERLSGIYGLPGLFLSCLFSGALRYVHLVQARTYYSRCFHKRLKCS